MTIMKRAFRGFRSPGFQAGRWAAAVLIAFLSRTVAAQGFVEKVRGLQQDQPAEAELPDVSAIEKGARPRASVSFGGRAATSTRLGESQAPAEPGESSAPATRGEATATGLAPPGGVYGLDSQASADNATVEAPHAMGVPELHNVKKGDTLWSICEFYFRDPWRWPRLWAQNPLITNAHWIFPGDVLRLRAPDEAVAAAPAPAGPARGMSITSSRTGSFDSKAVVLRQYGFISGGDVKRAGAISGSREEKQMLATGDSAYVSFRKELPLRAGERYSVFTVDTDHPVVAPGSREVLGYMVRIYGDIVVDQIAEQEVGRGTLVDVMDPIERGFLVSPLVRQFRRVEPRPSGVNLESRVVASFTPVMLLSAESFVVLSRGKRDGLEVGNRTFVVRRGDGHRPMMEAWDVLDTRYPKDVVGELWIVDVRDGASIAWVARTNREIRVGETTETRKGH